MMTLVVTSAGPSGGPESGNTAPESEGEGRFILEGQLDFETASEALSTVADKIRLQDNTVLDLGGVTTANSAGLALMVEWLAVARRSGKSVRFENVPDSLTKIAIVCQVDNLLQSSNR